jgi:hypothetical protein
VKNKCDKYEKLALKMLLSLYTDTPGRTLPEITLENVENPDIYVNRLEFLKN